MPAGHIVHVYYPQASKPDTLAFDYPIGRGGLAFHGAERRLDNLVKSGLLRKVETDKIDLPTGIHSLDIKYENWLENTFNPNIKTRSLDTPSSQTGLPSKTEVPVETPSLKIMKDIPRDITTESTSLITEDFPTSSATYVQPHTPRVDPTTGAVIMPNDTPPPDLSAELDPEFVNKEEYTRKIYKLSEIESMPDDQIISMARVHGFKGNARSRAITVLIDNGEIEKS